MLPDAPTYNPVALPAPPPEHTQHTSRQMRRLMAEHGLDALAAFGPRNHYYVSGMLHPLLYDGVPTGCAIAVLFAQEQHGRGAVEMEFMAPCHAPAPDLDIRTYSTWTYIDNPYSFEGIHLETELTSTVSVDKALRNLKNLFDDRSGIARVGVDRKQMHVDAWVRLTEVLPHVEFVDASLLFAQAQSIKSAWEIEQVVAAHDVTQKALVHAASIIEKNVTVEDLHRAFMQHVWSQPNATGIRFDFITVGQNFSPSAQTHRRVGARPGDIVKFDLGAEVNGYGADIARNFVLGQPSAFAADVHASLLAAHDVLVDGAVPGRSLADLYAEVMSVARRGLPRYNRGHVGHSTGLEVEMHPHVCASDSESIAAGMVLSLELPYYGYGVGAFNIEDMVVVGESETRVLTTMSKELEVR